MRPRKERARRLRMPWAWRGCPKAGWHTVQPKAAGVQMAPDDESVRQSKLPINVGKLALETPSSNSNSAPGESRSRPSVQRDSDGRTHPREVGKAEPQT